MRVCAIAAWLLLAAAQAQADDSSAALKAGGLVLTRQADIRMAREDLFVSPKEVRVRYEFVNDAKAGVDTFDRMPAAARRKYAAQGIVEIDGGDAHPHWIARTRHWWRQRFPAGRTVAIAHRYQPVTGQFFFGESGLALKQPGYARDYCMDAGTTAAVRAKVAKLGGNGPNGRYLLAYRTDFVLVTANNWKGPIGHFHLTLDKLKPDNVLSLCWDGGLKKTGATTFESVRDDFVPKRDIGLLVLQ